MSTRKAMITVDGEWLLAKFQKIEYILDEIRTRCAKGSFVRVQAGDIDISDIEWLLKASEPAGDDDPWAWAFAYNQDGEVRDEAHAIVTALLHETKVRVGQYEISWGGREKDLLSRKIPKPKGRKKR